MIIGQSLFQIAVNLILLYLSPALFHMTGSATDIEDRMRTVVFNVFVFMQIFNEFNSRKITDGNCLPPVFFVLSCA